MVEVPEDLSGLSVEDLETLAGQIRDEVTSLAEEAQDNDETLTRVEGLAADFARVNAEIETKKAEADDRKDRLDDAVSAVSGSDADDEDGEDEDGAEDGDGEDADADADDAEDKDENPLPVAAATEDAEQLTVAEEIPSGATPTEAAVTTPATPATPVSAAALQDHVPAGVVVEDEPKPGATFKASNTVASIAEGTDLDFGQLAEVIASKSRQGNNWAAGSERTTMATATTTYQREVGGGYEGNFEVFESLVKDFQEQRSDDLALVAAGGNCAPLAPSYEFFRLAEEMDPWERGLPVAGAERGGIRFITPPNWVDARAGVRVTTEAQDAAGYGNGSGQVPPKPCVVVECPPVEECRVDAVSKCVQFGNLNYRVFPEQVASFLKDLSVAFVAEKEEFYANAVDAASTEVTAAPAYGATRGATTTLLKAAANYRRRHHMSETAQLELFLPSWFVDFIKSDLVNDHSMGLGFLEASTAQVSSWLANMNLSVTWYYEGATGAGQNFDEVQNAGVLNNFPDSVVAYIFAPGTFVRLDAGVLDLGMVRDSVLNGTNDLQLFSEQWIQVCQVGFESIRLEITLCPDGTAPEPVMPLLCGASA